MKHKARLTISRYQGDGGGIHIRVKDEEAGIEFLDLEVSLEEFANALTGMGMVPANMEVRGIENVGKRIERMTFTFPLPEYTTYKDRKRIAAQVAQEVAPEGWTASSYFGSQESFFTGEDGLIHARTSLYRWVDKDSGDVTPED